jgi:hypothetical protein
VIESKEEVASSKIKIAGFQTRGQFRVFTTAEFTATIADICCIPNFFLVIKL